MPTDLGSNGLALLWIMKSLKGWWKYNAKSTTLSSLTIKEFSPIWSRVKKGYTVRAALSSWVNVLNNSMDEEIELNSVEGVY